MDPYEVATTLSFDPELDGVRRLFVFDAMHDDVWTERAVMGHEGELSRLDKILTADT